MAQYRKDVFNLAGGLGRALSDPREAEARAKEQSNRAQQDMIQRHRIQQRQLELAEQAAQQRLSQSQAQAPSVSYGGGAPSASMREQAARRQLAQFGIGVPHGSTASHTLAGLARSGGLGASMGGMVGPAMTAGGGAAGAGGGFTSPFAGRGEPGPEPERSGASPVLHMRMPGGGDGGALNIPDTSPDAGSVITPYLDRFGVRTLPGGAGTVSDYFPGGASPSDPLRGAMEAPGYEVSGPGLGAGEVLPYRYVSPEDLERQRTRNAGVGQDALRASLSEEKAREAYMEKQFRNFQADTLGTQGRASLWDSENEAKAEKAKREAQAEKDRVESKRRFDATTATQIAVAEIAAASRARPSPVPGKDPVTEKRVEDALGPALERISKGGAGGLTKDELKRISVLKALHPEISETVDKALSDLQIWNQNQGPGSESLAALADAQGRVKDVSYKSVYGDLLGGAMDWFDITRPYKQGK